MERLSYRPFSVTIENTGLRQSKSDFPDRNLRYFQSTRLGGVSFPRFLNQRSGIYKKVSCSAFDNTDWRNYFEIKNSNELSLSRRQILLTSTFASFLTLQTFQVDQAKAGKVNLAFLYPSESTTTCVLSHFGRFLTLNVFGDFHYWYFSS